MSDDDFGRQLNVDIVTPSYRGIDSLASRTHIDGAYTTGLAALRRTWPQFNISHQFLMSNLSSCLDEKAEVQDALSNWYYRDRRPDSVPIILTAGEWKGC